MFSPSAIRKALEHQEPKLVLATDDWYSRFCESNTHVTPQTKPNMHNTDGRAHVGGVYQEQGLDAALGELATVLTSVAMIVCRYFKFSDLFDEISRLLRSARTEGADDES